MDTALRYSLFNLAAGDVHYNIGGLAVYTPDGKDPYVTIADSEDEDSEKEDDAIKPDDNLVLVGRVEGDANILEIFGIIIFPRYSSFT